MRTIVPPSVRRLPPAVGGVEDIVGRQPSERGSHAWAATAVADDLARRCQQAGLDLGRAVRRPGAGAVPVTVRYLGPGRVLEVATSEDGRRRLRLEALARTWAHDRGIPTPEVLDADPDGAWLIGEWIAPAAPAGVVYLEAAAAAAELIAAQPGPPPIAANASTWRAPRRTVLTRGARLARGGLPLQLWFAARRQLAAVGGEPVVSHGDFYPRNVIATGSGVSVVDWEYAGWAHRGADLVRLWTVLESAADRDWLLAHLAAGRSATEQRRVGALLLWYALRLLGENLSAPPRRRTPQTLAHARQLLPEACERARTLGAWPR